MKAIKLTIIFALVVAVIVGAFYVFNDDDTQSRRTRSDDNTFKEYREQFTNDWDNAGDWDETLFRSHCETLKQLGTDYDVESIRDMNSKMATDIVYKKVFAEWKKTDCQKNVVDKYIKAVSVIEAEDPNASADPNIEKIKKVNTVYQMAYELANQKFGLRPQFNGTSWNSFSGYTESIKNKQKRTLGVPEYKEYLSNISDIKKGLDNVPAKLSAARTAFYQSLAGEISSYYSHSNISSRTESQLQNLRTAVSRYAKEYGNNGRLSSLVNEFKNDVIHNEY